MLKKNKKYILLTLFLVCSSFFMACSKEDNPINKKPLGDRSDQMAKLPMSSDKFNLSLTQKIAPIAKEGYNLKTQAISIKGGRIDKDIEVPKIENMITRVSSARDTISEIYVEGSDKDKQKNIISALDDYSIQLRDYKNLLSKEKIKVAEIQSQIDRVISALDMVKQYSS